MEKIDLWSPGRNFNRDINKSEKSDIFEKLF